MEKRLIPVSDSAPSAPGLKIDNATESLAQKNEQPLAVPATEKPRTPGLKLFDLLLYPLFTNVGVFGISVAATYLTTRGGDRNAAGKLIYGEVGNWFQKRGNWMVDKFKAVGMSHGQADMSKMVFFSFFDGSLLSPFVKLFEDRREKIACKIDEKLGTKPEDLSVYQAEPKQTWLSVLGGRLATAAIVVPTAVALDKAGLNDVLFNKPGLKMGEWLSKKPGIVKLFGKLDVKEISRIALFEAFYTSVCTAGLYFSSRWLAGNGNKKLEQCAPDTAPAPISAEKTPDQSHCAYASQEPAKTFTHEGLKRTRATSKSSGSYRDQYLMDVTSPAVLAGI